MDTAVVPKPTCFASRSISNRHGALVCAVVWFGNTCDVISVVAVAAGTPVAASCGAVLTPNAHVAVVLAVATNEKIPFAMTLTSWFVRPGWKKPAGMTR